MKSVLIGLGVVFLIVLAGVLILFAWMAYTFVFVDNITERQARRLDDYQLLAEGVRIREVPYSGKQPERDYGSSNDVNGEWRLLGDGVIKASHAFANDPGQSVYRLPLPGGDNRLAGQRRLAELWQPIRERLEAPPEEPPRSEQALIFSGQKVYREQQGRLGELLGTLQDVSGGISYAAWIDSQRFVIVSYSHTDKGTITPLWQATTDELVAEQIVADTYYLHCKLPDVYRFAAADTTVLVYFTGNLSWGFGGDVNKPQSSVIRIYNPAYPDGKDIASISFAGGMIRDVSLQTDDAGNTELILLGDTTRPSGAKHNEIWPPRQWILSL